MQTLDGRSGAYRARLLEGMQQAVARIGYAELTIGDVVSRARVSRRTFYEHFASKEECMLALFEARSDEVLATIEAAIARLPPGEARIDAGVTAYLASIQADVGAVRTRFMEIYQLGEKGLQVRRRILRGFAELLGRELRAAGSPADPSPAMLTALVGGINELVLEALEEDRADRLVELYPTVAALIHALMAATPAAPPPGAA
jgi:AcrR family transcriptional regulator